MTLDITTQGAVRHSVLDMMTTRAGVLHASALVIARTLRQALDVACRMVSAHEGAPGCPATFRMVVAPPHQVLVEHGFSTGASMLVVVPANAGEAAYNAIIALVRATAAQPSSAIWMMLMDQPEIQQPEVREIRRAIVVHGVCRLPRSHQAAMRKVIESHTSTATFIFTERTSVAGSLDRALLSRSVQVRVPDDLSRGASEDDISVATALLVRALRPCTEHNNNKNNNKKEPRSVQRDRAAALRALQQGIVVAWPSSWAGCSLSSSSSSSSSSSTPTTRQQHGESEDDDERDLGRMGVALGHLARAWIAWGKTANATEDTVADGIAEFANADIEAARMMRMTQERALVLPQSVAQAQATACASVVARLLMANLAKLANGR